MPTKRQITNVIREAYDKLGTWQDVNDVLYGGCMSNVVLSRIANPTDTYWPVEKEYTDLLRPPKPKPLPHELAKRTLVISASEYELHEIQELLKPRDRAKKLLL